MVATVQYLVHYALSTDIFFRLMMHCIYCVHWVEFHGERQAINKCNLKKVSFLIQTLSHLRVKLNGPLEDMTE